MGCSLSAEELLSVPRGRRLCWSLLDALLDDDRRFPAWRRVRYDVRRGAYQDDLEGLLFEVSDWVAAADPASISESSDELRLLAPLAATVDEASYWEPPDDVDRALADEAVRDSLLPLALAVTAAPATTWWSSPVPLDRQRYVEWTDDHGSPARLSGAAGQLASWRNDVAAPSSEWWSTPRPTELATTTRTLAGLGAIGLCLVEDGFGCEEGRCWPVEATRQPRVYEITGPQQWIDLVGAYPLDVTQARRDDWRYLADWHGTWLIPDFQAAASDYDAIHLSVAGYVGTAGHALIIDGARTLLAGWDPDETYWLTDILTMSGQPRTWKCGSPPVGWEPEGQPGD
jgi:hypothetical protein